MGLYSRDYYRELSPAPGVFGGAPVVKYIIIINVAVFLLQIFLVRPPRVSPEEFEQKLKADRPQSQREVYERIRDMQRVSIVQEWFELDAKKVVEGGQVWRLVTHAFCHDRYSVFHILFNMLFLFWFGRTLEMMYGSREFLLFYLTAAVCAGLAYVGMNLYTDSPYPAVGASGAVMAVMMLYTMHFPYESILIFWFIPIQMRWLMLLYLVWDLHPVLLALAGDQLFTGVAHAAHLGGLIFGFLYYWYNFHLSGLLDRFSGIKVRSRPRLKLYKPAGDCRPCEPDTDSRRLDEVLEKISRSGKESLTEEEHTVLVNASEKLKTRARGG